MNAKSAFKNTFKQMNAERPVFIPFVYGLAAKLGQFSVEEMVSDAGYYTHLLEDAYNLLKCDGIVNHFDAAIEAQVLGCDIDWPGDYAGSQVVSCGNLEAGEVNPAENSRVSTLMETTKRIVMSQGRDTAIIGILTGPCSLASAVAGESNESIEKAISLASSLLLKMVKSLCELRVDAVFFREDTLGAGYRDKLMAHGKPYTDAYTTLFNLIKYYNCPQAVIVRDIDMDFIPDLQKMIALGGLILQGKKLGDEDLSALQKLSDSLKISFGLPLPMGSQDELLEQYSVISQYVSKNKPQGFFYVSDGEIPGDMPLEALHDLVGKMQSA